MTDDHGGRTLEVSASEFRALFDAVSTWGRWGEQDQGGALHHLDPAPMSWRPPGSCETAPPSP